MVELEFVLLCHRRWHYAEGDTALRPYLVSLRPRDPVRKGRTHLGGVAEPVPQPSLGWTCSTKYTTRCNAGASTRKQNEQPRRRDAATWIRQRSGPSQPAQVPGSDQPTLSGTHHDRSMIGSARRRRVRDRIACPEGFDLAQQSHEGLTGGTTRRRSRSRSDPASVPCSPVLNSRAGKSLTPGSLQETHQPKNAKLPSCHPGDLQHTPSIATTNA